jgi:Transposase
MSAPQVVVGREVSKAHLDGALRLTADHWHVRHDALGITGLVERRPAVQPTLVGLEATGGREVPEAGALAEAGLPVVMVHPRHARECATATGRWAKTDPLEARGLAHVAAAVRPTPRPLPAGPGARAEGSADAPAPTGAEAHGRTSPSAAGSPAAPSGHPGPQALVGAPLGPPRC